MWRYVQMSFRDNMRLSDPRHVRRKLNAAASELADMNSLHDMRQAPTPHPTVPPLPDDPRAVPIYPEQGRAECGHPIHGTRGPLCCNPSRAAQSKRRTPTNSACCRIANPTTLGALGAGRGRGQRRPAVDRAGDHPGRGVAALLRARDGGGGLRALLGGGHAPLEGAAR